MKKIFSIICLLSLTLYFGMNFTKANEIFSLDYKLEETQIYDGIKHTKAVVEMTYNGVKSDQHFNYIGANTRVGDINVITSDAYQPNTYSMASLKVHIDEAKTRFPQLEILGGVNADFYDINNTGRPSNIHVVDYEVINKGGKNQKAAGFLDNGDIVFGTPTFLGQYLNIVNEDNEIKKRIKIDKVNQLPANDIEMAVFYEGHQDKIPADYHKVVVKAVDVKVSGSTVQYAKGTMKTRTTDEVSVQVREFVLVGKALQDENLITQNDTIIIQEQLGNGFEDTRFAIGLGDHLVANGVAQKLDTMSHSSKTTRNPRTAIGKTASGIIFFIVIDGRDVINGKHGVKLDEMAELMKLYGAVEAYNLDGGGSSTMLLKTDDSETYQTLNTLSDGRMRSISNGLLFVRGNFAPKFLELSYPDTRTQYAAPTGLFVDDEGVLHFVGNNDNNQYMLKINGRETYITQETSQLLLMPGTYEIQVKVKGDQSNSSSNYSEVYTYNLHKSDIKKIIDLMNQFA